MIFAAGVSWKRVVTFALMIIPAGDRCSSSAPRTGATGCSRS